MGSHTALTELYGIANSGQSADGRAVDGGASEEQFADPAADGQPRSLREVIDADKAALLGDKVARPLW